MANALLKRPKVIKISIASHKDLSSMIDKYAIDTHFKYVISVFKLGKKEESHNVKDGYFVYGNRLCVAHSMHEKMMYESHAPQYARYRETQAILKGSKM